MKNEFYINDDYAGMESERYSFYYGYEHEYCSKCKKYNKCEKENHYDFREWSFFVEVKGMEKYGEKIVFEASKTQIKNAVSYGKDNLDMPSDYLMAGINLFLNQENVRISRL